jgi:hypothetical protein
MKKILSSGNLSIYEPIDTGKSKGILKVEYDMAGVGVQTSYITIFELLEAAKSAVDVVLKAYRLTEPNTDNKN